MFFKTSSGNGLSEVNGPPGALCINKKEIIIKISIVGMAINNLFIINLNMLKEKAPKNRCFKFVK